MKGTRWCGKINTGAYWRILDSIHFLTNANPRGSLCKMDNDIITKNFRRYSRKKPMGPRITLTWKYGYFFTFSSFPEVFRILLDADDPTPG